MRKSLLLIQIIFILLMIMVTGCSSPEEKARSYYQNAQILFDNKDYDKALVELKNAIKINPKMAEAYYLTGLIQEQRQNWKAMFINMAKANKLAPEHVLALVALGKINLLTGEFDQAKEKVKQAFAIDAKSIDTIILNAAIYYKQSQFNEKKQPQDDQKKQLEFSQKALNEINKALKTDPTNLEAIALFVAMSLPDKNYEQIIQVIYNGSDNEKNKKNFTLLKIKVYAAQGKQSKVINLFGELIFQEPENLIYRQALALYFIRMKDMEGAKRVLRDAVLSNPDSTEAKLMLASFLSKQDLDEAVIELKKFMDSSDSSQSQLKFALAEIYQQKGEKEKALDVYKNILEKTEEEGEILLVKNNQARIAISGKDYQDANKLIQDVLDKEPNNPDALLNRALILIAKNDIEAAITDLRVVLRDKPDHEKTQELLAAAYLYIKKDELASDVLSNILQRNPFHIKAANQNAFLQLKKRNYEKAIQILTPLENSGKLDTQGFALMMQARLSAKDWQAAAEQAAKNKSTNKEEYKSYIQALILQGQEKYQQSNQILKTMLEKNPDFETPLAALINNYNKQDDIQASIDYLQQYTQQHSENILASTLLAKQYTSNKDTEKAIEVYQNIIKKKPDVVANYKNLAALYDLQDDTKKVAEVYQQALEHNPDSGYFRFQLASNYEKQKRFADAISQYEILFEKNPESKPIANNLASLLSMHSNKKGIERAYQIARQFDKTNYPYFADTLGWIYYLKGDYDNALRLLKVAVQGKNDEAIFNYHLGKAYYEKNDLKQAKQFLNNAVKLSEEKEKFSEYDDAQEMLNKFL